MYKLIRNLIAQGYSKQKLLIKHLHAETLVGK